MSATLPSPPPLFPGDPALPQPRDWASCPRDESGRTASNSTNTYTANITQHDLIASNLKNSVTVTDRNRVELCPCLIVVSYYRSGTINSNTVNSKFHLIRSFFEIFAKIAIISCLKCMVNFNMVNLKFHQFKVNLTGDWFEVSLLRIVISKFVIIQRFNKIFMVIPCIRMYIVIQLSTVSTYVPFDIRMARMTLQHCMQHTSTVLTSPGSCKTCFFPHISFWQESFLNISNHWPNSWPKIQFTYWHIWPS